MDRDAIVRRRRRQQAEEALEFERERERALLEQVESILVEEDGRRVDEEAFARMSPAEAELARELLDDGSWVPDDEEDDVGLDADGGPEEEDEEDELARLDGELAACRARQRALERYIEVVGAPAPPP